MCIAGAVAMETSTCNYTRVDGPRATRTSLVPPVLHVVRYFSGLALAHTRLATVANPSELGSFNFVPLSPIAF